VNEIIKKRRRPECWTQNIVAQTRELTKNARTKPATS
jgi:hypothetical protein